MIPTVVISDGAGGFYIINADDYDPLRHRLYASGLESEQRRIALGQMSLSQLRSLAEPLGISGRTKSVLIDRILAYELDQLPD